MRKVLTDASLLFSSDVAARALNFITLVVLARQLQPERYGLLVIGTSALEYAFLFSDWGLKTLGTRETSMSHQDRRFQPSTILAARILLGLAVFALAEIIATVIALDPLQTSIVRTYLLCVIPFALMIDWYAQGRRSFGVLTISRIIQSAALLLGVLAVVATPDDVAIVPWLQVGAMTLAAAFLFLARPSGDRLVPAREDTARILPALKTSTAIGAAGLFGQTFVVLPALVVAEVSGPAAAGVLHAALRLVVLLLIIDRVFGALYLPALSARWSRDGAAVAPYFRSALRLLIPLGAAASLLASIHAVPILRLVYDEQYVTGALSLSIAAWFILATLLNTYFAFALIAIGQERLYLRAGIASGSLFVVLLILAASVWGAPGAAGAIVVGETIMTALLVRSIRPTIDVRPLGPVAAALGVAAALALLAHVLDATTLWLAPVYLLAFTAAVIGLRIVRPEDLALLRSR